ncbi:NAD(P)/FAD-dependent oxidoreductase [Nonomuraea sp. NPDC049709]|uniref:FAD-dependent oxidoreductase n=1 Tax=Nonomuraea sp. NPDC049709 TaxID=3154736 RepID=UPI00344627CF
MSGPQVIVVGAGPVGLTAALTLANAGVTVVVHEAEGGLSAHSRACTFHPATLDLLAELGVAGSLIAAGMRVDALQWRTRDGDLLAQMNMGALAGTPAHPHRLTAHPFRLHVEQRTLTALLLRRLGRHPHAQVRFGAKVEAISDTGPGVRVRTGRTWESARYVIAADGAHSTIRAALGLAFPVVPYPTRAVRIMTDTPLTDVLPGLAPLTYVRDKVSRSLLQLPDHWRIVVRVPAETFLTRKAMIALARRALPPHRRLHVLHLHTYRLARAVLPCFRRGRVLFAGDAAHLASTAGGLNMNAGLHDAAEAGQVLAAVLAGAASTAALEGWAARRRTITLDKIIPRSEARVAGVQDGRPHHLQAAVTRLRAIADDPAATRAYLAEASLLDTLPLNGTSLNGTSLNGTPLNGSPPHSTAHPIPHPIGT